MHGDEIEDIVRGSRSGSSAVESGYMASYTRIESMWEAAMAELQGAEGGFGGIDRMEEVSDEPAGADAGGSGRGAWSRGSTPKGQNRDGGVATVGAGAPREGEGIQMPGRVSSLSSAVGPALQSPSWSQTSDHDDTSHPHSRTGFAAAPRSNPRPGLVPALNLNLNRTELQ